MDRRSRWGSGLGPGIGAFVEAQDVAAGEQREGEVGADLAGGAGDEDVHG